MKKFLIYAMIIICSCSDTELLSQNTELQTREVAGNLKTVWEILWGPDNYIWLTERYGRISRVNPETGEIKPLITISDVYENGEGGLMGMALHPDFSSNPYVYVVYDHRTSNNTFIRIERYTYNGEILTSPQIILDDIKGAFVHNGSRIFVDNEQKIWFTIGEVSVGSNAQSLDNLNGKLSRMNIDGSVPADNPFPGNKIWSFGHRNQQGMVFANGKIYTAEHGANIEDEINIIQKGRNYGWPTVEGYCDKAAETAFCQEHDVVEPILTLLPNSTLAIAGIDYYDKNLIPEWNNSLIITALKTAKIVVAKLNDDGTAVESTKDYFVNQFGRLRDVCISPDGRVFFSTSNQDGRGSGQFQNVMDKIIEVKPSSTGVKQKKNDSRLEIFPNPSNNSFIINLQNTTFSESKLTIVNSLGQKVREIFTENSVPIIWDGRDNFGNACMSGIYRVIINDDIFIKTAPLVLKR